MNFLWPVKTGMNLTFERENVTEFNPSQLFMLDLFISHVMFCCYIAALPLSACLKTNKLVYICSAWVQSLTKKGGVHVCK